MHPEIEKPRPGFCPICGMALEPKQPTVSEDNAEYRDMFRRFWVGGLFTLPVLLLAMSKSLPSGPLIPNNISHWIQFILSTPVALWAAAPFYQRAWLSILNLRPNMFTLFAMGIGTAYFYSAFAVLFPGLFPAEFKENGELFVYFEAASVITVLTLFGQVLELKAKGQTGRAIKALLGQTAKTARLIVDDREKEIAIEHVHKGNLLRVKPGDRVPVDGEIVDGSGLVDESMISGEPLPVQKKAGDAVTGGTLNQKGSFLMKATRVGKETVLAQIIKMVSEAQRSKAPIQRVADVVSSYFVPAVLVTAIATFIGWSLLGPEPRFVYGLVNAVAVLIIACPCALGLATPMSIMVGVGRGAELGVLIKNAEALERLEKVDTIALDKTGTLTEGKPRVTQVTSAPQWDADMLLRLAAAVENFSEHPLASAVVEEAKSKDIKIPKVEGFDSVTGKGVVGTADGKRVCVGALSLLKEQGILDLSTLKEHAQKAQEEAQTVIYVGVDKTAAGFLAISDPIKKSTPPAIERLHHLGLKVIMLTGDNVHTAEAVAKKLNIDEVHAGVNPGDKHRLVEKLRSEKRIVAMAGDGINDSPALAASDVGIAMGTGTDVAIESAGVTLVKGDLTGIVRAITLSRATMRNIRQNLFFAFVYNVIGVPIAAGVLYPWLDLLLNPMIASAAMAFSSVSVIVNALRLNRVDAAHD